MCIGCFSGDQKTFMRLFSELLWVSADISVGEHLLSSQASVAVRGAPFIRMQLLL